MFVGLPWFDMNDEALSTADERKQWLLSGVPADIPLQLIITDFWFVLEDTQVKDVLKFVINIKMILCLW